MGADDLRCRERIANRARRNVSSEVKLILSAGFALFAILLFAFAGARLQFLAISLGLSFFVVWIGASFAIAAIWALAQYLWVGPRIAEARKLDAAALHSYEAVAPSLHEDGK